MNLTARQLDIIGTAGKLLTSFGLSGLTVKNIAKEMHFAESTLYRHFQSKEEIIVSMLQYLADSIDSRLKQIKYTENPEKSLKILFKNQLNFFAENPHFVASVFSDGLMEETENINNAISKLIKIKTKYLSRIITEGQQKKIFTDKIPAELLVNIIMGSFKLQMLKWRMDNFGFDIKKEGNEMVRYFLILIRNNK
ncbi:MAG: TetR/AcrR family transcriptional regulator [Chlorobi bacterium]|nr:TetR/AcrR family transcriptional regulator [Chlorobiota bacterium]